MEPVNQGLRSRSGCMTCRRKHRKCDEGQPKCQACQIRGLECDYSIPLRWTTVSSTSKLHKDAKGSRVVKRGGRPGASSAHTRSPLPVPDAASPASLPQSSASTLCLDSQPASPPWRAINPTSNHSPETSHSHPHGVVQHPKQPRRDSDYIIEDVISPLDVHSEEYSLTPHDTLSASPCHGIETTQSDHQNLHSNSLAPSEEHFELGHEVWSTTDSTYGNQHEHINQANHESLQEQFFVDSQTTVPGHSDASLVLLDDNSDVPSSPTNSTSWVIDNTLSNLLFQIFQSPGEEIAFTYFFKRVCTCIPAHDSTKNPWRNLALVSLSHPVLLHGILSVATAHMHNCGRSNVSVLSSRQSRALHSLQAALNALQESRDRHSDVGKSPDKLLLQGGVFSILSATEIALAAVMMQTSSVLMTGAGNVEMHLKCALHFIKDLGYLCRPPDSIFSRTLVNRFAMVDVVHAHLRFRRPLASFDFFMYQEDEKLDHGDPAFREMHGCDQRVLCFLAEIAVLSADLLDGSTTHDLVQAKAYTLETEMRIWGHKYYNSMIRGASMSKTATQAPSSSPSSQPSPMSLSDISILDIVCECFYWTAQLLLLRRLFLDPTKSSRVQLVRRHLFQIMDKLEPGCGPDSSLPFKFYMASREATTLEERDWVRRKHAAMMEVYRDRSREYMMEYTEKIWDNAASVANSNASNDSRAGCSPREQYIRELDKQSTYFMF